MDKSLHFTWWSSSYELLVMWRVIGSWGNLWECAWNLATYWGWGDLGWKHSRQVSKNLSSYSPNSAFSPINLVSALRYTSTHHPIMLEAFIEPFHFSFRYTVWPWLLLSHWQGSSDFEFIYRCLPRCGPTRDNCPLCPTVLDTSTRARRHVRILQRRKK